MMLKDVGKIIQPTCLTRMHFDSYILCNNTMVLVHI